MAQAQIEANKRFRKKSYDRIEITVPKGDREKIVQAASAAGMSVNAFIKEALVEYIARTTKQYSLTVPEWKSPVAAKATGQRYTIVTPIRHTKEDQTKM